MPRRSKTPARGTKRRGPTEKSNQLEVELGQVIASPEDPPAPPGKEEGVEGLPRFSGEVLPPSDERGSPRQRHISSGI